MVKTALISLASLAVCASVQALEFSFSYSDTLVSDFAGVAAGAPVLMTLTFDNGGTTAADQLWTSADLRSVEFNVGGGQYVATMTAPFGGALNGNGFFQTDAAGDVTSIETAFYAGQSTDFVTSLPTTTVAWFANAANDMFFVDQGSMGLTNVTNMANAAAWGDAVAVPESSTVAAFAGLGALGLIALRRKRA